MTEADKKIQEIMERVMSRTSAVISKIFITKTLSANRYNTHLSVCHWKTINEYFYYYEWLWKSVNSDSQQFHRYQQNEQPPFTSNYWTKTIPGHFPDAGLGHAQKCLRVKMFNRIPTLCFLIIGSPMDIHFFFTDMKKGAMQKPAQIPFHSKGSLLWYNFYSMFKLKMWK